MTELDEVHYLNTLSEEGEVRDLVVECNELLQVLRDRYGEELSRRSAVELHDESISERLSDLLEDLSYYDDVVANFWINIQDHDRTGDYIPRLLKGGFLGLDQVGKVWDEEYES